MDGLNTAKDEARNLLLKQMLESQSGAGQDGEDDWTISTLLVATGLTRFGVLILAIYLVQILINLYRYNTRVAAD